MYTPLEAPHRLECGTLWWPVGCLLAEFRGHFVGRMMQNQPGWIVAQLGAGASPLNWRSACDCLMRKNDYLSRSIRKIEPDNIREFLNLADIKGDKT